MPGRTFPQMRGLRGCGHHRHRSLDKRDRMARAGRIRDERKTLRRIVAAELAQDPAPYVLRRVGVGRGGSPTTVAAA